MRLSHFLGGAAAATLALRFRAAARSSTRTLAPPAASSPVPPPPTPASGSLASLRVAVVGAGIGGLAAALALARRGVKHVAVFERASEQRHSHFAGFGFSLAPNGLAVLRALGALDVDLATQLHPLRSHVNADACGATLPFAGGALGSDIGFLHASYGDYMSGVERRHVVLALRTALAATDATIVYSTDVTGVTTSSDGATATLHLRHRGAGGDAAAAETAGPFDLVIGADGIHSTLRQHVYGRDDAATYSGVNLFYGLTPAGDLSSFERTLLKPATLFNYYGVGSSAICFGAGQAAPGASDGPPAAYVWAVAVCGELEPGRRRQRPRRDRGCAVLGERPALRPRRRVASRRRMGLSRRDRPRASRHRALRAALPPPCRALEPRMHRAARRCCACYASASRAGGQHGARRRFLPRRVAGRRAQCRARSRGVRIEAPREDV